MLDHKPVTFWQHVYDLRRKGLIARTWRTGHLTEHLEGAYATNTITLAPYNFSISREGDRMGGFVERGQAPRAWRVGRGQFQLVVDPEDDVETQTVERNRARERAKELRSRERRPADGGVEVTMPSQPSPQNGSVITPDASAHDTSASGRYTSISVTLTESERQSLTSLPTTEKKALFIVRKHLEEKYGGRASIQQDRDGVDLRVEIDGKTEKIEVKGTEKPTIAWQQLKVSSQKSHDSLESRDASLYRVVDIDGTRPHIYVLTYGRDFTLEPEPRWMVKRVPPKDDRYPLRGEPYRYELPYDPVAAGEWEARG